MDEKRFWTGKYNDQPGVARDLENHLANPRQGQSSRLRRKINSYDPWADWFNAGLDPEPVTDNFKAEPYFGPEPVIDNYHTVQNVNMESVSDSFSVQEKQNDAPTLFGELTQASIWDQEQQGYNTSFYPVAEYPPIVEESLEPDTEDGLSSASQEQQKTEKSDDKYEVRAEQENERDEERTAETNYLVWREFPKKSC